ncbi:hypothetical protein, partial [Piscirickettsia salmonis]|uniref:hypothetical protein n=1 Tax=Piscirickettsia salmonis TaxID=1238 RepID=UPI001C54F577
KSFMFYHSNSLLTSVDCYTLLKSKFFATVPKNSREAGLKFSGIQCLGFISWIPPYSAPNAGDNQGNAFILAETDGRKRRYLGRYFAHPMMQNRRAKRDDYKPSAVRVTQCYVP